MDTHNFFHKGQIGRNTGIEPEVRSSLAENFITRRRSCVVGLYTCVIVLVGELFVLLLLTLFLLVIGHAPR